MGAIGAGNGRRIGATGALVLVSVAALVSTVLATGAAGSAEPPADGYTVEDFVVLAQSVFPELSSTAATCIGEVVVPALSLQDLALLFGDRQAPLKAGAKQQGVLRQAVDDCVDRPTAVEVIAGWARSTLDANRLAWSDRGSLPYEQLRCVDDAMGDFSPGDVFFAMYRRPAAFMDTAAAALGGCLDVNTLAEMVSTWTERNGIPGPDIAVGEQGTTIDVVGTSCLQRTLLETSEDDEQLRSIFEAILLAASPEQLDHRLVELRTRVAECGLVLSRNFGR